MVNIWDYANNKPRVGLRTKNGEKYTGKVYMVWDAEESDDEQDSITVEMQSGEIRSFYPDEIESIEALNG